MSKARLTVTATTNTGRTLRGQNLLDIYKQMNTMLRVDGPRSISATTATGTEILASLYPEQDYIRTAGGRNLLKD